MTPWGSPARGAPDDEGPPRERTEGRLLVLGRSALAPLALAVTTVAGVAGAVLALLPAAVRRRPAGRAGSRRDDDGAAPETEAAGEPLAP